jgi:iron(III) transport system substrate-binding protein
LILPEVTDPANWLDNRLDFADKDELILAFVTIPQNTLVYDPNQVSPEEVDDPQRLLEPKWRGRIVLNDPTLSGAGQNVLRFLWYALGPERGADYIRALRAQLAAVDREERRQIEWVARGRYPILLGASDTVLAQLQKEGLRVGKVVGWRDYGTSTTASGGAVTLLDQAPHPNAAKVFINWLLSRDGQIAYSTAVGQASRRLDVPTDHLAPEAIPQPGGKYWPSYYEENVVMPAELRNLIQEVFNR